jgi:hypothetical protein
MSPHRSERAALEMKIMRCRQLASRIADDELRGRFWTPIAERKQKLREIDE